MFGQRKGHDCMNAVPKLMSNTINKYENSETPIKQYTNDKLKENFLNAKSNAHFLQSSR